MTYEDLIARARRVATDAATGYYGDAEGGAGVDVDALVYYTSILADALEETTTALLPPTDAVAADVAQECARQNSKWGIQDYPDGTGPNTKPMRGIDLVAGARGYGRSAAALAEAAKEVTDENTQQERPRWSSILLEEVFEALAEDDAQNLREELVQVAAVAQQWVASLDRRAKDVAPSTVEMANSTGGDLTDLTDPEALADLSKRALTAAQAGMVRQARRLERLAAEEQNRL